MHIDKRGRNHRANNYSTLCWVFVTGRVKWGWKTSFNFLCKINEIYLMGSDSLGQC